MQTYESLFCFVIICVLVKLSDTKVTFDNYENTYEKKEPGAVHHKKHDLDIFDTDTEIGHEKRRYRRHMEFPTETPLKAFSSQSGNGNENKEEQKKTSFLHQVMKKLNEEIDQLKVFEANNGATKLADIQKNTVDDNSLDEHKADSKYSKSESTSGETNKDSKSNYSLDEEQDSSDETSDDKE